MDKKLYFMITSDRGKTRTFSFAKQKVTITICLILLLSIAGLAGINFFKENLFLETKISGLQRDFDDMRLLHERIRGETDKREQRQQAQLQYALNELHQRSQVIKSILDAVGVEIKIKEDVQHNIGGPYIQLPVDSYENLTFRVDYYLDAIRYIPLGPPVAGTITSKFGRRIDPFNKKPAFHSGIDIRNKTGTEIIAPAYGKIIRSGYTRLNGNFVEIDHMNGFTTNYLHLKKTLVERGENVARGQPIGLLGNTGRSTGPHLHYGIEYHDKAINPLKFMRIAQYLADNRVSEQRGEKPEDR